MPYTLHKVILGLVGFIFIAGIGTSTTAYAEFEVPNLYSPVTDHGQLISHRTENHLNSLLKNYQEKTGVQFAILTVESLEGLPIEQASILVTDSWKLGDKNTDKGLLLLVAPKERKVRIEIGQGLEGDLTDLYAKRIIDYDILPEFKRGRFENGIITGTLAIINKITPGFSSPENSSYKPKSKSDSKKFKLLLEIIFILLVIFFGRGGGLTGYLIGRSMGGSRYSGGGGFSGGGFSGGGGGFSGGGASGGW